HQNSLDIADILNNKLPPLQTDVAYNKTQISKIKKEMLTIALNVMMNKALLNAETKDFYSIIADVTTPEYPNGFKNTLILPTIGVTFDNDGGGIWTEAIKITLTTIPSEYAIYKIVIQSNTMQIYAADGTLKAEYGAQTGIASDFWNNVKSDGSDIRLADQNYQQLYFWIEQFDYANSYAVIWVRIPAGTSELYIAYGNPSAIKSSYEDGNQVFEFFDDFEGTEFDAAKWDNVVDAVVESGMAKIGDTANDYDGIISKAVVTLNMAVEAKMRITNTTTAGYVGMLIGQEKDVDPNNINNGAFIGMDWYNEAQVGKWLMLNGSQSEVSQFNGDPRNAEHIYKIKVLHDGVVVWECESYTIVSTGTLPSATYHIIFNNYDAIQYTYVDWVKAYKLTDPADFGTAETIELVTTGDFFTVTFDFPEGVDKLLITVDTDATAIYYSTDDGATWNPIQPDEETLLPETAYSVKWKFEFASYVRGYAFITW
ncbi:MAG: hypothetical protein DRI61_09575, partial [Chloroflexi bacterium]